MPTVKHHPLPPVTNACGAPIPDDDRHVPQLEAAQQVGVTRNTINAMIERGQFPPKHHITPGRVGFWQSELNEWHKTGPYGWYERYGKAALNAQRAARREANAA